MAKNSGKGEKTNAMRVLEQHGVPYVFHCYEGTGAVSGQEVAAALGQDPAQVFKTLVTVGHSGEHYVFVVPVCGDLNLKKAAVAVGEKNIEMIRAKELLPLTGYIHGGCSPIGMKKPFRTVFDESAEIFDTICFSAGRVGYQVELAIDDLRAALDFSLADISL